MRVDLYRNGGYGSGGISENGGSISGSLVLAGNPSQTLEAVPKQYVDAYYTSLNANNFTSGTINAARLPAFTGDLISQEGTSVVTLSDTGINPGSYGKVTVNNKGRVTAGGNIGNSDIPFGLNWNKITTGKPTTLTGYGILDAINKNGGTLTGFLTVNSAPTLTTHIVNKQYVDSIVAGGGIAVGDIIRKPYSTTPSGFLKCNGAEVDKTTYAALYSVIGDSFTNYITPGSGQPWKQQYQINTTQSGDITGWGTETALPAAVGSAKAIMTKNRVYLLGGYSSAGPVVSTVYTSPVYSDGLIAGWSTGTNLPVAMGQFSVFYTKNRVYLLGGYNNSVYLSSVYVAPINADGTIGTWATDTSLPIGVRSTLCFVTKNRVYLLGGNNASGNNLNIYTAPINSDGTLGTWTTNSTIPNSLSNIDPIITKNRVYVFSGIYMYTTIINADGTLGTWNNTTNLPSNFSYSQSLVTKNRVYLLGGYNAAPLSITYTAPINSDGTLGTWTIGTSLPSAIYDAQAIVTKNKIYLISGYNASGAISSVYSAPISGGLLDYSPYYAEDTTNYMMPGSGKPWQQQYQINTTQSTDITSWTTGTSLPAPLSASQAIVTKNRVYLLGGYNGSYTSIVYTATINADGTLSTWSTGTSLPGALGNSQAIVTKNRVYLLGGQLTGGSSVSTIYTAPINADGTLGTWATDTSLPGVLSSSQAILTKNRVYLLGGSTTGSNALSTVYTAPINADGTLGAWITGTSLPVSIGFAQAIVTKNRVHLIGGYNGSYLSTVYTAAIYNDGTLGTWTTGTSLPGTLAYPCAIATKDRVYLMGSSGNNIVYTAPINANGTLGTWTTGTSLINNLCLSQPIVTKNTIYLLGGDAGGVVSTVLKATISANINDYSPYYDGTITAIESVNPSTVFRLPDLTSSEQYKTYNYIKY